MARKPKSAAAAVTSPIVETELAVQRLRDLDRALVERQIALESDGVSVNAPPTGARHAQARALLDDLPPPPIVPDERDPTNELRAIVEQRATIAVAIRMAGERWATQEQERQIERIAERLPEWRSLVWRKAKAIADLKALIREERQFLAEITSSAGPPAMPGATPLQFALTGC